MLATVDARFARRPAAPTQALPSGSAASVLSRFGLSSADLLGEGDEARVYALDEACVLRVPKHRGDALFLLRLRRFLDEIDGRAPFRTPVILDIGCHGDTVFSIESRIPGRSLTAMLPQLDACQRRTAFRAYVDALDALWRLPVPGVPNPGPLLEATAPRCGTWKAQLSAAARTRMAACKSVIEAETRLGAGEILTALLHLIDALPDHRPSFVHGDYWPSNVMMDESLCITGVVDFGTAAFGDPMTDAAGALTWLELLPACTSEDRTYVRELILARYGDGVARVMMAYRAWFALRYLPDCTVPDWRRWYAGSLRHVAGQ